jgi:hypothetical protein
MAPVRQHLKPLNHILTDREGYVTHKLEVDGVANICVRASTASGRKPLIVGLRVSNSEQDPALLKEAESSSKDTTDVDKHLTHMEMELKRITTAMNYVLREADFNKDQDAIFHKQTMAMDSATTFWPIVQVCVLLMTGFTQASHIVRFFKSRRII